ncbi:hypothetical protein PENSPDRAFT_755592 [Peniophora sp. CONT]|nr:hypothetical protein PENSPDRAFT_755592 [Peniophora sp. CONT]
MSEKSVDKLVPRVQPIPFYKVFRIAKTQKLAFAENPMRLYLDEFAPEENSALQYIVLCLDVIRQIDSGVALMVDDGDAVLLGRTPPNTSSPPSLLSRIIARFESWYMKRLYSPSNPHFPAEGQKRREEFRKRIEEEVDTGLGESKGDMWYVNVLATRPEAQGKGYASALMRHFADMADSTPIWLHSSDYANTGFYEYMGYRIRAETMLGENDESWKHDPVHMTLMVKDGTDAK